MSDPNETKSEQQAWPPAPIQDETDEVAPVEPSQGLFNISLIFKGFGLGFAAGSGFSLIPSLVVLEIATHTSLAVLVLALPLVPEFFIARRLYRYQKVLGATFGLVSIGLSALIEIAMLWALAGWP